MENLLKVILSIFFSLFMSSMVFAESEITLFDNSGESVVYIDLDDDDLAIYTWDGESTAYLDGSLKELYLNKTINVYGFNGEHLGWFFDGIIMNHNGDASCVIREKYPGEVIEYGKYGKYGQYGKYGRYAAPAKPAFSGKFGNPDCLSLIKSGE
jgi:hypothetical protein